MSKNVTKKKYCRISGKSDKVEYDRGKGAQETQVLRKGERKEKENRKKGWECKRSVWREKGI
ncbi:hypothetical protein WN55_09482 [Dufourea novaeangliae]|uniref:Uncharacterized protein n=1 Tax=Dufourea novaeangliae TaxID=178035 RepID=A0A154NYI6_DUFNO|nr:hypothetical protein WN55_09482 [Dufourea novaeangliae]